MAMRGTCDWQARAGRERDCVKIGGWEEVKSGSMLQSTGRGGSGGEQGCVAIVKSRQIESGITL